MTCISLGFALLALAYVDVCNGLAGTDGPAGCFFAFGIVVAEVEAEGVFGAVVEVVVKGEHRMAVVRNDSSDRITTMPASNNAEDH